MLPVLQAVVAFFCFVHSLWAFPSQSLGNTTQTISASSWNVTCSADCHVEIPELYALQWFPISITTTITHATVVYIINSASNTTKTSTIFNEIPSGYRLPQTNEAGTVTTTFTGTRSGTTFTTYLAYPTEYYDYPGEYHWDGILATTSGGAKVCSTRDIDADGVTFSSHPDYPQPVPTIPSGGDEFGTLFTPWYDGIESWPIDFYTSEFPEEAAFTSCSPMSMAPATVIQGADFLTVSSTSYEDSGSTSTDDSGVIETIWGATPLTAHTESTETGELDFPHPTTESQAPLSSSPVQVQQTEPETKGTGDPTGSTTENPTDLTSSGSLPVVSLGGVLVLGSTTITLGSEWSTGTSGLVTFATAHVEETQTYLIAGTRTIAVVDASPGPPASGSSELKPTATLPPVVVGGTTYMPDSPSAYSIAGETLSVGGSITISTGSETRVLVLTTDNQGATIVAGVTGIGDYIVSGLGGAVGTGNPETFQGGSTTIKVSKDGRPWSMAVEVLVLVLGIVVLIEL